MLNRQLNLFKRFAQLVSASMNSLIYKFDGLSPVRQWINGIAIQDAAIAHLICRIIPVQCPFARKIQIFGHTVAEIPALCKLNPLYEEVVSLRFRALCYLADDCGQDIRIYC